VTVAFADEKVVILMRKLSMVNRYGVISGFVRQNCGDWGEGKGGDHGAGHDEFESWRKQVRSHQNGTGDVL